MTSGDYIESKTIHVDKESVLSLPFGDYVKDDDAYEAVDMAVRNFAWKVHELICDTRDFSVIDKYVTDICDF